MQLLEVTPNNRRLRRAFLDVHIRMNQHDPNWIRPLDKDVEAVFDPRQNIAFQHGECIRWVLLNDSGAPIGRIAAFTNQTTNQRNQSFAVGGIGFFDCIDDQPSACMLFDAARQWLEARGMQAMDGPINFGERDRWWGLLVDGFLPPNYQQNYNPAYYRRLFEAYGFANYFEQYTYGRAVGHAPERIHARAARILQNTSYRLEHIQKKRLNQYIEDFTHIYNAAFGAADDVPPLRVEEVRKLMYSIMPIMDERLMWFAYYQQKPIGMMIMLPEVNDIFKHLHGRFDIWAKLKFLYLNWQRHRYCRRITGIAFGIVPRFQGRGVDAAFVSCLESEALKADFPYEQVELNWVGDFNPVMMRLVEDIDFHVRKKHITYRKIFDPSIPFERHPVRSFGRRNPSVN